MESTIPQNLREAVIYYSDEKRCLDLMVSLRFPNGLACINCGDTASIKYMESVKRFKCYGCRKQFSIKNGTVLEDSPISLTKWIPAFWLLTSAKNGISSCELARSLGVTQKTAWFMLHRIRHILATGSFAKMTGTCEADETFIGGLERNKHEDKKLHAGRGTVGKVPVIGVLERSTDKDSHSKVRVKVAKDTSKKTLHGLLESHVENGTPIYTDAHRGYTGLDEKFIHEFIDHAVKYAEGAVHTNGMENYWSLLKRTLKGTYVAVEPCHLAKYIDEQAYRFNSRKATDAERFIAALKLAAGKRITYAELTSAYNTYFDEVLPRIAP